MLTISHRWKTQRRNRIGRKEDEERRRIWTLAVHTTARCRLLTWCTSVDRTNGLLDGCSPLTLSVGSVVKSTTAITKPMW